MATHDYVISNDSGAAVRADLNTALAAIVSNNSSATAPATTYAYMWWADTTSGYLKQRDSANAAWVTVMSLSGGQVATLAGTETLTNKTIAPNQVSGIANTATSWLDLPAGTTAQQGSPSQGAIRYNTDSPGFEGYSGSAWAGFGATFATAAENAAGTIENKAVDPLGIRESMNATGTAPIYACRAWVNFNGTGTVAIRASGNVSSITDNGTGDYTVNFTTAMSDASYVANITSQAGLSAYGFGTGDNTQTAAALVNLFCITHTGGTQDCSQVSVSIFR